MDDRPLLEGITILVLASVGPAARAARWLADWGANVVEVGPTPRDRHLQITPPPPAYAAHRGLTPHRLALHAAPGPAASLPMAAKMKRAARRTHGDQLTLRQARPTPQRAAVTTAVLCLRLWDAATGDDADDQSHRRGRHSGCDALDIDGRPSGKLGRAHV